MPFKFNPFTGNFDQTGSGGGATVFDGEVQFFSNLPQTVGTPPVNSAYLVRESEGTVWFGNKKQKGIYIRSGNSGVRNDDWTYGGEYPVTSVNGNTGAVTLNAADVGALQSAVSIETYIFDDFTETLPARRNAQWQVSFTVSGGTRTLSLPSASVQVGDRIRVALTVPASTTLNVVKPNPGSSITIATVGAGTRFVYSAQVTQLVGATPVWLSIGELSAAVGASPLTSSSDGAVGQFSFSDNFMYVCIADNTWRRVPIAAF